MQLPAVPAEDEKLFDEGDECPEQTANEGDEGDDGDDVMSEIECGDDGVPSVTAKSSRRLGGVKWSDLAVQKRASSDTGRIYVAGVAFGLEP